MFVSLTLPLLKWRYVKIFLKRYNLIILGQSNILVTK